MDLKELAIASFSALLTVSGIFLLLISVCVAIVAIIYFAGDMAFLVFMLLLAVVFVTVMKYHDRMALKRHKQ